jgi:outer membrane protein assembly factor BamB
MRPAVFAFAVTMTVAVASTMVVPLSAQHETAADIEDGGRVFGNTCANGPHTFEKKWEFKMNDITWAGVLSTAGDVVFSGGREGYFFALDSRNGALLWKIPLGGQVNSGPMSYSVNGKQFVAVAAGTSLFSFALRN